jgi:hypothetical protein
MIWMIGMLFAGFLLAIGTIAAYAFMRAVNTPSSSVGSVVSFGKEWIRQVKEEVNRDDSNPVTVPPTTKDDHIKRMVEGEWEE